MVRLSRLDPTSLKLLAEMPLPNLPGSQDNLQGFKVNETAYWNFSERVDWVHSDSWRSFVRFGWFKAHLLESNPTDKKLLPVNGSNRYGTSLAADTVYSISPKLTLNLRGNFHQLTDEYAADRLAEEEPWGWSKPSSILVLHPAMLLADYNGNPQLKRLIAELADGFLAHRPKDPAARVVGCVLTAPRLWISYQERGQAPFPTLRLQNLPG